jgi:hypothetical protein
MSKTNPYDRAHRADRAQALALLKDGDPCPFCRRPMRSWQSLDLDHVVPVYLARGDGPKRLAHQSCNRRAGGRIGALKVNRRRIKRRRIVKRKSSRW